MGAAYSGMHKIDSWLKTKGSYSDGLSLYRQFGKSTFLLKLFEQEENAFTRQKLQDELRVIFEASEPIKELTQASESKNKEEFIYRDQKPQITPLNDECIQPLVKEKADLYAQSNFLRAKINTVLTNAERFALAEQIVERHDRIREIWQLIDDFKEKGLDPFRNDLDRQSPVKLAKRRETLQTYLSKYKTKNDQVKLARYQAEYDYINKLLVDAGY